MRTYPTPHGRTGRQCILLTTVLLLSAPAVTAEPLPLPPAMQENVNKAIDSGALYLRRTAGPWGTWAAGKEYAAGYAALPGLTLLECGVPPQDPAVRNAAVFARLAGPNLDKTYEISLAILFLDRLGEAKDRPLIQKLALRLIAGQTPTGGWTYKCPILSEADSKQLLAVLKKLDAPVLYDPIALKTDRSQRSLGLTNPVQTEPSKLADSVKRSTTMPVAGSRNWAWCIKMETAPPEENVKPRRVVVPANLRGMPVLFPPPGPAKDPKGKGKEHVPVWGTSDNSNTQFAILALWAARRHQVPTARTLNLVAKRFYTSQNPDGSWGYHFVFGGGDPERPSMTCVGLVGLAVYYGLARDMDVRVAQGQDPRIVSGLLALSKSVGTPTGRMKNLAMANLYFLWSVERVGVLYDLPTIGGKDWYRWGAEVLLANQAPQGNWANGAYYGSNITIDTCLALLFLKRANLAKDLTTSLPFKPAQLVEEVAKKLPPETRKSDPRTSNVETPSALPEADASAAAQEAQEEPATPAKRPTATASPPAEEPSSKAWLWLLGLLALLIGSGVAVALIARHSEQEAETPSNARREKRRRAARA